MSSKNRDVVGQESALNQDDLCLPVYLDQATAFDLLAFIEDGLYQLETVTTSTGEADSRRGGVSASLGTSNAFSFLRVGLAGGRDNERSSAAREERQRELVYTPASLFAKLRFSLKRQQLIVNLSDVDNMDSLQAGNLIEFRGVLNENPAIASIETPIEFEHFLRSHRTPDTDEQSDVVVETGPPPRRNSGGSRPRQRVPKPTRLQPEASSFPSDIAVTLEALKSANERELLCDITTCPTPVSKALISTRVEFFSEREFQVLFGWDVRVLGYVVRVIKPGDDAINLVRRTTIGRIPRAYTEILETWIDARRKMGVPIPSVSPLEVPGPAIHVKAIAAFL